MKKFKTAIVGVGKGGEGKAATAYPISAACTSLEKMLDASRPDIVSICTYASSHRVLVEQCLPAGVKAIWCEKPLCLAMDDGRAMLRAAEQAGAKVIVNHYRRYLHLFREAKRILEGGAIGAPSIITASLADWDLMEWGTHWLDMMRFFVGDQPVLWVIAQARCTGEKKWYGHVMEEHAICYLGFSNGVRGLLDGGLAIPGTSALNIIGTEAPLIYDGTASLSC